MKVWIDFLEIFFHLDTVIYKGFQNWVSGIQFPTPITGAKFPLPVSLVSFLAPSLASCALTSTFSIPSNLYYRTKDREEKKLKVVRRDGQNVIGHTSRDQGL